MQRHGDDPISPRQQPGPGTCHQAPKRSREVHAVSMLKRQQQTTGLLVIPQHRARLPPRRRLGKAADADKPAIARVGEAAAEGGGCGAAVTEWCCNERRRRETRGAELACLADGLLAYQALRRQQRIQREPERRAQYDQATPVNFGRAPRTHEAIYHISETE